MNELLGLLENYVGPRGKEKTVGGPLAKFQLSYSGIGLIHNLSSEGNPYKISVAIFRSLIDSYFEHPLRLLPNLSGDFIYLNSHLVGFPSRQVSGVAISVL